MIPKPIDDAMNDGRIRIPLGYLIKAKGYTFQEYWKFIKGEYWSVMLAKAKIRATGD